MRLEDLRPAPGAKHRRKKVGRGPGSGHGKTATKGSKGQQARSGGGKGVGFEGGQMPLYRRLPKRGFLPHGGKHPYAVVNLADLGDFAEGSVVDPDRLVEARLVRRADRGRVKILGEGEVAHALVVRAHAVSEAARAKIEAKGGRVEVLSPPHRRHVIENLQAFQNVFKIPELKRRVLITLGLLVAYRIGAHVPTPGIDGPALAQFFDQVQGTLLGMVDLFSGGNLRRLSVFALGIMPYISASIILQLLTVVIPALERLAKEGEAGRKKITQYTRYGTIGLSLVQSLGIAYGLESMSSPTGVSIVPHPGWGFRLLVMITLTAGTALIMWLGEQISERGIGNGISLIIFAGIVVRLPSAMEASYTLITTGELKLFVFGALILLMVAVTAAVVLMQEGQRKIPVQYAKRMVGRRVYGGSSTHIPLRINTAGVIPVIFASSLILFPATLTRFVPHPWMQVISDALSPGRFTYTVLYMALIVFFAYFYTAIVFNPVDLADNMKKYGGFIPGVRPGKRTAEYIDRVLTRITLPGALFLAIISVLPDFLIRWFNVPFYFGGTSLLIVVGVALDTVRQMESHLLMRNYEGFLKRSKSRPGGAFARRG